MEKKSFCFSNHTPIVIYGCNKSGENFYYLLNQAGYIVECFLDNRAVELHHVCSIGEEQIPVCKLEEYEAGDTSPIILIAIRDSVEQTNVARNLWKRNFQKVVFLPMIKEHLRNSQAIICMRKFYRDFTEGKIKKETILPMQSLLWEEDSFWDHAVIQENESELLAWMPISLIHFYSKRQAGEMSLAYGIQMIIEESQVYYDKNVFQLKWLNDLFEFFIEGKGDLEDYWSVEKGAFNYIKKQSSRENQLWMSDRQKCIEILMSGMNQESGILMQSAIPVQWNENGYFNICDGAHRLVFLNCLNMQMAPVQLSRQDYEKWVNAEKLEKVLAYIRENQISSFEAPIPHPWFYGCEVREDRYGKTILRCIFEFLKQLDFLQDFSVLDVNPKDGYYLQHFARINAGLITGIVEDKKQYDLIMYFNQLFYLNERISLIDEENAKKSDTRYDVVLMLKKLCMLREEEQIQYITWAASKAKRIIVWESGMDYEKEKELILQHSEFKNYIFLKRTLSENIIREVGIFVKETG